MSEEWTDAQREAARRRIMARIRGEADAAAGFYRPRRKNLMTCMVIIHDGLDGAHLADCDEFRNVTESLLAWSSAVPCWQANWVPEFDALDAELFHRALGVIIDDEQDIRMPVMLPENSPERVIYTLAREAIRRGYSPKTEKWPLAGTAVRR